MVVIMVIDLEAIIIIDSVPTSKLILVIPDVDSSYYWGESFYFTRIKTEMVKFTLIMPIITRTNLSSHSEFRPVS